MTKSYLFKTMNIIMPRPGRSGNFIEKRMSVFFKSILKANLH